MSIEELLTKHPWVGALIIGILMMVWYYVTTFRSYPKTPDGEWNERGKY